jgi:hypothetical protein
MRGRVWWWYLMTGWIELEGVFVGKGKGGIGGRR